MRIMKLWLTAWSHDPHVNIQTCMTKLFSKIQIRRQKRQEPIPFFVTWGGVDRPTQRCAVLPQTHTRTRAPTLTQSAVCRFVPQSRWERKRKDSQTREWEKKDKTLSWMHRNTDMHTQRRSHTHTVSFKRCWCQNFVHFCPQDYWTKPECVCVCVRVCVCQQKSK